LLGSERTGERYWDGALDGALDDAGIWDNEISVRVIAAVHGLGKFNGVNLDDAAGISLVTCGNSNTGIIWQSSLDGNAEAVIGSDGVISAGLPVPTIDTNGNAGGALLFYGGACRHRW
jgi:hypothetical protein